MDSEKLKFNYSLLKRATEDLNLQYETQDWGIINSDYTRINEFIEYYYSNSKADKSIRYDILELIIASYNDAMLEEVNMDNLNSKFSILIDEACEEKNFEPLLDYWRNLRKDDYPVSRLIRSSSSTPDE